MGGGVHVSSPSQRTPQQPTAAFAEAAKRVHVPAVATPSRRTDGLLQLTLVSTHPRRVHWDIPEGYCPPRIRPPTRPQEHSHKRLLGMMVNRWEIHRRQFVEMQGVDTYERLYGRRAHDMEECGTEEEEEEEEEVNGSEEGD